MFNLKENSIFEFLKLKNLMFEFSKLKIFNFEIIKLQVLPKIKVLEYQIRVFLNFITLIL